LGVIRSSLGRAKPGFLQLHYATNGYPTEAVSLYPHKDPFNNESWRKSIHCGGAYFQSEVLAQIYRGIVNGTPRLISVDGESIDVPQDRFNHDFPNWAGFDLFHIHVRKTLIFVLGDVLMEAEKDRSITWRRGLLRQVPKNVVIASHKDLEDKNARLATSTERNGFTFHEFAQSKPVFAKPSRHYLLQSMEDRWHEDITLAKNSPPSVQSGDIDETEAISQWSDVLGSTESFANARTLIDAFVRHYREVRIQGAFDSLMLEWGSSRPMLLQGFVDIRHGKQPQWGPYERRWIGVTRQINAGRDDDNTALCVYFYFGPVTGNEPSGTIEIEETATLDLELERFFKTPYVEDLVAQTPESVSVFAGEVG
jgi:hypothetical protein